MHQWDQAVRPKTQNVFSKEASGFICPQGSHGGGGDGGGTQPISENDLSEETLSGDTRSVDDVS